MPAAPALPQDVWAYLHPATSWPWYLLFATLVLALGTVATAMYLTAMPARAASPPSAQNCTSVATARVPACHRQRRS